MTHTSHCGLVPGIRDYRSSDEQSWLRCRVLGFLDTAYFDDVWTSRPVVKEGLGLVADHQGTVVALCDASILHDTATIDTIAVHPDHRRTGLGAALIALLLNRLRDRGVTTLDAWTRDDPDTLAWYAAQGFQAQFRYLHVYADSTLEMEAAGAVGVELLPRSGFFHADVKGTGNPHLESRLRTTFRRVHACQRMVRVVNLA